MIEGIVRVGVKILIVLALIPLILVPVLRVRPSGIDHHAGPVDHG